MACLRREAISEEGRRVGASVARIPVGRCSKAFCSSDFSMGDGIVGVAVTGFEGERLDLVPLVGEPSTGV